MRRSLLGFFFFLYVLSSSSAAIILKYQWSSPHLTLLYADTFSTLWIDGYRSQVSCEKLSCYRNVVISLLKEAEFRERLSLQVIGENLPYKEDVLPVSRKFLVTIKEEHLGNLPRTVGALVKRSTETRGKDLYAPLLGPGGKRYLYKAFFRNEFNLYLNGEQGRRLMVCLLYTSPSPRDLSTSRMPSSA